MTCARVLPSSSRHRPSARTQAELLGRGGTWGYGNRALAGPGHADLLSARSLDPARRENNLALAIAFARAANNLVSSDAPSISRGPTEAHRVAGAAYPFWIAAEAAASSDNASRPGSFFVTTPRFLRRKSRQQLLRNAAIANQQSRPPQFGRTERSIAVVAPRRLDFV